MSSINKDTYVLDDNKDSVVTMTSSEKKSLTTEKVTTSNEVHKQTEKVTIIEEVVKGTDEVHKRTEKNTTNEEVGKGTENWMVLKRQWSQSIGRIQICLRVILKYL